VIHRNKQDFALPIIEDGDDRRESLRRRTGDGTYPELVART
jgi:hypothetical protein